MLTTKVKTGGEANFLVACGAVKKVTAIVRIKDVGEERLLAYHLAGTCDCNRNHVKCGMRKDLVADNYKETYVLKVNDRNVFRRGEVVRKLMKHYFALAHKDGLFLESVTNEGEWLVLNFSNSINQNEVKLPVQLEGLET